MRSGLYGLVRLDGAPLDPSDLAVMDLQTQHDRSLAVRISDASADGVYAGIAEQNDRTLAFTGYLNNLKDLAARLALRPDMPAPSLVLAAFDRWDDQALHQLDGEWSLMLADRRAGRVLIANAPTLRDPMFFASDGHRLAVAPTMALLSDLPWVGGEFAETPLLQSMSSWPFRSKLEGRTWLEKISCVDQGCAVVFDHAGHRLTRWHELRAAPLFKGDFREAVAVMETRCRALVAGHLRRHRDVAVLLSGGLDSSTLAWLVATERQAGQKIHAVASVGPKGGGFADEADFARLAASHLGLPLTEVSPGPEPSAFRPSHRTFAFCEQPSAGPRHYLYEALFDAADQAGASAAFDGQFGEQSLTGTARLLSLRRFPRTLREDIRTWMDQTRHAPAWPGAGLQVAPSQEALAIMTRAFGQQSHRFPSSPLRLAHQPVGLSMGAIKAGRGTSATPGLDLRTIAPFRDPELMALAAGMPAGFSYATGLARSFARAMIADGMPKALSRRTSKTPFSPDFYDRLKTQALPARMRISLHRRYGADEWLDLNWLDKALASLAETPVTPAMAFKIQNTATAAEFITWWRSGHA
jgi:asparagine synthase (glutamine-hydrolysing)